ncbi:MAG: hypothetical protein LBQ50_02505 [Planctomycetaceae bacterium]|jgi:hypothetical protein|nr:hypothetical protein [Planctomycetaceae bacterium]
MGDLDREMLLGYLMNALEDDEIAYVERELLRQPALRSELAALQKELSPLTYVYESVDPPYNLAQRTCHRIWEHVDRIEQNEDRLLDSPISSIISMTIPAPHFEDNPIAANHSVTDHPATNHSVTNRSIDNRSEVLGEILAASASFQPAIPATIHSEHFSNGNNNNNNNNNNNKRLIRQFPRSGNSLNGLNNLNKLNKLKSSNVSSPRSIRKNRWFDFTLSITVGILIAVIAFPVINYAKNRTENYFTKSKIHEINKSIDHYTQLQGITENTAPVDNSSPINLTQSGWQELKPTQFPVILAGETGHSSFNSTPIESFPGLLKAVSQNSTPFVSSDSRGRDIILGQTKTDHLATETFPLDTHEFIDQTLISNVNHVVPGSDGTTIQTAYGQNVLFQNGRIFFRILPVFTPKE